MRVTDACSQLTQVEGPMSRHHSGQRPSLTPRASHRAAVPNLPGTKDQFPGRQLLHGMGRGNGFRMIQAHYVYCALYFYYYCISSTSDHQALDPGEGWGCLPGRGEVDGSQRARCRKQRKAMSNSSARQVTKHRAHCLMCRNL